MNNVGLNNVMKNINPGGGNGFSNYSCTNWCWCNGRCSLAHCIQRYCDTGVSYKASACVRFLERASNLSQQQKSRSGFYV